MATAVGVASDVESLLRASGRPRVNPDDAISQGWLWRSKIEGVWVYGTTDDAVTLAAEGVDGLSRAALNAWLLGPLHPLAGFISKRLTVLQISKNASMPFVRRLLRQEELGAVAALTAHYEPYLAAFLPEDEEEVRRQVDFLTQNLSARGRLSAEDLPEPRRRRSLRSWRDSVLRHGEYLGLGRMAAGELIAWP